MKISWTKIRNRQTGSQKDQRAGDDYSSQHTLLSSLCAQHRQTAASQYCNGKIDFHYMTRWNAKETEHRHIVK
jgi:hypothetical protein